MSGIENGHVVKLEISSKKSGEIRLENPFGKADFFCGKEF
jgi:hypothetical protein